MVKKIPKASHEGPVRLGKWEVYAHVLTTDPPMRVLSKDDSLEILSDESPATLIEMLAKLRKHPALKKHAFLNCALDLAQPIHFHRVDGKPAEGFDAEDVVELCRFLLKAREYGLLRNRSDFKHAQAAEGLVVSLAKVGVTALIDEATGYQRDRDRDALQKLLDQYLRKEYAAWAKRFPDDFYVQMFRLKRWPWQGMAVNRPSIVGTYTRDIVYARLAPGVLKELETLNPRTQNGHRKTKHHQWMTEEVGHPELDKHLHGVLALMRAASSWKGFNQLLKKAYPRYGDQLELLDLEESDLD